MTQLAVILNFIINILTLGYKTYYQRKQQEKKDNEKKKDEQREKSKVIQKDLWNKLP